MITYDQRLKLWSTQMKDTTPSPFPPKNENDNLHRGHNSFLFQQHVSFKMKKEDKQTK